MLGFGAASSTASDYRRALAEVVPAAVDDLGGTPDLAVPFTFPADRLLERLNEEQAGLRVVGGMASGGTDPGQHRLICGLDVLEEGAVGVALVGPVDIRTVVSQGCRPIGAPYAVTRG